MTTDFNKFTKEECTIFLKEKTSQLNQLLTKMVALSPEERELMRNLTNELANCRMFAATKGWLD